MGEELRGKKIEDREDAGKEESMEWDQRERSKKKPPVRCRSLDQTRRFELNGLLMLPQQALSARSFAKIDSKIDPISYVFEAWKLVSNCLRGKKHARGDCS
ncbi:hypothetical protein QAD02_019096 [Eretmocerus hayati]|uniref:Uncharacterized protein n=1 Tax=Eretmocerus hayati TaxID=131215 RepID=A0ACC2PI80_9HYME|nr:hypothetical protein QAD02_019096 [Eretmocerus hayati]